MTIGGYSQNPYAMGYYAARQPGRELSAAPVPGQSPVPASEPGPAQRAVPGPAKNQAAPQDYGARPGADDNQLFKTGRGNGPNGTCLTCESRRYVDVSDDSSVSFQTPTKISPEESFSAVRAHEMEHVRNRRADAESKNGRVVAQSVTYKMAVCPECGKYYKAGGTTRTLTKYDRSDKNDPMRPEEKRLDTFV